MKYVVTGGGGFLGKALVTHLVATGANVVSIARGRYPEVEALGAECIQADIGRDRELLTKAFQGADGVFHVASKVDMWGRYEDFFSANVTGTRNVLASCRAASVRNLVYTSSPSVIAHGGDLLGVEESAPYPRSFKAFYPMTKALAEQEVRTMGCSGEVRTVALRPHLIWGPGDTNLIPTIVERARAGRLPQVGGGENMTDLTYIDDCVQAHVKAMQALEAGKAISGNVYFISQGTPVRMWGWIAEVLERAGVPPVSRKVSASVAYGIASVCEIVARLIPAIKEPLLTRFLVEQMSTSHYFSIGRATADLGFAPSVSIEEGLARTFGGDYGKQR